MGIQNMWLEEVASKYRILVDTSALMRSGSEIFFLKILMPLLKRHGNKLIVPYVVYRELEKHTKGIDPKKAHLAKKGLKILSKYHEEELSDVRHDKADVIPDHVFQRVLATFKPHYDLAFITNDIKLGKELCRMYRSESVRTRRSMVVILVEEGGIPKRLCVDGSLQIESLKRRRKRSKTSLEFDLGELRDIDSTPLNVSDLPSEGDAVYDSNGRSYFLVKELATGGEGSIYLTNDPQMVAKIYHPSKLTEDIYEKIRIMVKNKDKIEPKANFSIAWPQELLYNSNREFVGYLMHKVEGEPLQKAIFHPKLLQQKYPHFKRIHLVNIAINTLEALNYLYSFEILMGDINAMNILVDKDCHISLIDTDSYQFGLFKCKVGRPEFTHPEKIGLKYEDYYREPKEDMFGLAILIFMILLPGRHPFSHQGGEGIIKNIKQREIPYRVSSIDETSYESAPIGPWRFIWSHIPLSIKEYLYEILKGIKEPESFDDLHDMTEKLIYELKKYAKEIEQGKRSNEIFPRYYYIPDYIPKVSLKCSKCGSYFEITQEYYENIKHRTVLCPYCFLSRKKSRDISNTLHSSRTYKTVPKRHIPRKTPIRPVKMRKIKTSTKTNGILVNKFFLVSTLSLVSLILLAVNPILFLLLILGILILAYSKK